MSDRRKRNAGMGPGMEDSCLGICEASERSERASFPGCPGYVIAILKLFYNYFRINLLILKYNLTITLCLLYFYSTFTLLVLYWFINILLSITLFCCCCDVAYLFFYVCFF